jgi:hypothetical protein
MARQIRIQYSGAFYHVTDRRNERRRSCRDDGDRHRPSVRLKGWKCMTKILKCLERCAQAKPAVRPRMTIVKTEHEKQLSRIEI